MTFIILIFVVSAVLLVVSFNTDNVAVLIPAVVLQYVGLIAERWFFFAQANHPQNIYYQAT